jgi:hypothetical protein
VGEEAALVDGQVRAINMPAEVAQGEALFLSALRISMFQDLLPPLATMVKRGHPTGIREAGVEVLEDQYFLKFKPQH